MSHAALVVDSLFPDEQRHKPQTQNSSTWQHSMVELADGRMVRNDSAAWIAQCEAMTVLSWDSEKRSKFFEMVQRHRTEAGVEKIRRLMAQVEPAYILSLATKEARQAYLIGVERRISRVERKRLEEAVMALWRSRQAKACNAPAA